LQGLLCIRDDSVLCVVSATARWSLAQSARDDIFARTPDVAYGILTSMAAANALAAVPGHVDAIRLGKDDECRLLA
jgi:hypothetical protein